MKYLRLIFAVALSCVLCSCGAQNSSANEVEPVEEQVAENNSIIKPQDYSTLIKTVYEKFVFAIDADPEAYSHPERYFTTNALKTLKDSYEFDCENGDCYAYYELRTQEQDSKPGTTGESDVTDIESIGDNWYVVKYSDMGWSGMTRIKIVDDKIDDFTR